AMASAANEAPAENPEVDDLAAELAETVRRPSDPDKIFGSSPKLPKEGDVDFTEEPTEFGVDASQVNLGATSAVIHGLTESRLDMSQERLGTAPPAPSRPPRRSRRRNPRPRPNRSPPRRRR